MQQFKSKFKDLEYLRLVLNYKRSPVIISN